MKLKKKKTIHIRETLFHNRAIIIRNINIFEQSCNVERDRAVLNRMLNFHITSQISNTNDKLAHFIQTDHQITKLNDVNDQILLFTNLVKFACVCC